MKDIVLAILATALACIILLKAPPSDGKVYDCSLAEFHPDYPPEVKEGCRKYRKQRKDVTSYST